MLGLLLATANVWAMQITGKVTDAVTGEPLVGASVYCTATYKGTASDTDGVFTINLNIGDEMAVTYIGYEEKKLTVAEGIQDLNITLNQSVTPLKDIIITSQVAIQRKTPVAASTIDPIAIETKLGNQEFPELLKSTPGVYVTKNGGGYGDSQITMRGFQSTNVAVMINGVPMNDMEWGGLYWSNWAGLADITTFMQTQRGLGASKVSAPSVGGSINIITRSTETKRGGSAAYSLGNDGFNKVVFSVSSGLLESGWAFTLAGGRSSGNGYVQGTDFVGWNWFVNISKVINNQHSLSLTGFGAPQWHNQRTEPLTVTEWAKAANFMNGDSRYKYNPAYGFGKNGERKSPNRNEYHKPQISLNHNWSIDNKSSLSTVLYASFGRGFGYEGAVASTCNSSWKGASKGLITTQFRNANGTFAYDKIQELNETSTEGSQMIMSRKNNDHNWCGLISTYTRRLPKNVDFYVGIDMRHYKGIRNRVITDLYNGDFYIDSYRKDVKLQQNVAASHPNFASQQLHIGDVICFDYDGHVVQEGVFTQFEGNFGKFNAFVAGSLSNIAYWRYDRFYYDIDHARSQTVNHWGGTIKGGANYNINQHNNIFANVGMVSRAPFFSGGAFLQLQSSNSINHNAANEKIFSAELGYGFHYENYFRLNLNTYYTLLMDKTTMQSTEFSYTNAHGEKVKDCAILNVLGVDARHLGIEIDAKANPTDWLEITGMLSIGDWRWHSNATGYFYNLAGLPLADFKGNVASANMAADHASMKLNMKGTHVSGSAQTTAALGVTFKPVKGLRVGTDINFFCRNYANWSIAETDLVIGSEKTYEEPWKIPGAAIWDANISYKFTIYKEIAATISGTINNIVNQVYITDASEGVAANWDSTYRVFYGFGRTWTCGLKIHF